MTYLIVYYYNMLQPRCIRRLGGTFQWSADPHGVAARRDRSFPGALETGKPVGVLIESDHEYTDGQPIAVARARLKAIRPVLEIPTKVLHSPLVWTELPPPVDVRRDRAGAVKMRPNRRPPGAREPPNEKRLSVPGDLITRRWARH